MSEQLRTAEYDVWLFRRDQTDKVVKGSQNYEDMLELIGSFDTVEKFWGIYSHLKRPSDLPSVNLSVFRKGYRYRGMCAFKNKARVSGWLATHWSSASALHTRDDASAVSVGGDSIG